MMADVQQDRYGMASGMYRTMNNRRMVGSFVVAAVASASASLAPFVESIRSTLLVSAVIMGIAVTLSWVRSRVHSGPIQVERGTAQ